MANTTLRKKAQENTQFLGYPRSSEWKNLVIPEVLFHVLENIIQSIIFPF